MVPELKGFRRIQAGLLFRTPAIGNLNPEAQQRWQHGVVGGFERRGLATDSKRVLKGRIRHKGDAVFVQLRFLTRGIT